MKKNLLSLISMLILMTGSLFAQVPNWTQPVGMQYSMQVVAKLMTKTSPVTYSSNPNDLVGAFVGNSNFCQGVESPNPDVMNQVHLTINSNNVSGEIMTLKAYIEAQNVIYTIKAYINENDAINGSNPLTITFQNLSSLGTIDAPIILVAAPLKWTITPTVGTDPITGTITPNTPQIVDNGTNKSFTMKPTTGYHFTSIMVNNLGDTDPEYNVYDETQLENDGSFIYEFENVTSSYTIIVNFEINKYDITFVAGDHGELTKNEGIETGFEFTYSSVEHGTSLEAITAVPSNPDDFSFSSWSDGVTDNPRTVTATHDSTLTAFFTPAGWIPDNNYSLTMIVIGKIVIDNETSVNPGDMVGAFVGNDCRGVASPNEEGLVFLSIGSNQATGEEITIKIWKSELSVDCG